MAACGGPSDDDAQSTEAAVTSEHYGESSFEGPPVVVIGLDGLEWSVLKPLMEAGRAPNMKALVDRGVGGGLATFQPTFSPVVWTSIATGVPREVHGVMNFSEADARGALIEGGLPYTSNSRRVPAIWNIASVQQRNVLSVGWWVSWPAEAVNGRVIASYAAQAQGKLFWKAGVWEEGLPEMTYPADLIYEFMPRLAEGGPDGPVAKEYTKLFGSIPLSEHTGDRNRDPWIFPRERDLFFRTGYHGDRTHLAGFKDQLRMGVADLNMVYFGLVDVAGHFWWRYYEPEAFGYEIPQEHRDLLQERIAQSYEVVDQWVGEIVELLPENARIMIISDHGMHAANRNAPMHPQSGAHEDAPPGVLIAAGPGIAARGMLPDEEWSYPVFMPGQGRVTKSITAPTRLGGVYDITPTLLQWLDLPASTDMVGAPILDLAAEGSELGNAPSRVAPYANGYRAATRPRVPVDNANDIFTEGLMQQLGYLTAAEQAGAPADG